MKILMKNRKKQAIYVAVLLACWGVLGWIWIPKFTEKPVVVDSSVVSNALNVNGPAAATAGAGSLLPFGEKFNTAVLKDARFQALIAPKILTLDPAELGRGNPFLPPEATPSGSTSTTTPTGGQ